MPNLPMLAFRITGIDEFIELTIDEVWGFPNEISYGGGYGAKGRLSICAGEYSVSAMHYFTTGELYRFFMGLKQCYAILNGEVVLENNEGALELKCMFNKHGHVFASGMFRADSVVKNILFFEIETDQTQLNNSISDLQTVYKIFGGNEGAT